MSCVRQLRSFFVKFEERMGHGPEHMDGSATRSASINRLHLDCIHTNTLRQMVFLVKAGRFEHMFTSCNCNELQWADDR